MRRKISLFLLLIFFFILFDRAAALLFRELNYSFYSKTKIKRNIFGKAKIIKKDFYDTMIFGTSRTKDAIHPLYLSDSLGIRAYKEAKPSRYPRYYYHFYKKFRSIFGKPKYLIYGIDYFIFNLKTSDIHLMLLNKKRKVKKLNYSKMVNESSPLFSEISLLFKAKKKIDNTVSDFLYKLSMDWESEENRHNAMGIEKYTGKKRVLSPEKIRKPGSWDKFEYKSSKNGEGKFLKMLFDELENDGVKVFLIGIPDYIGTYESNFQQDRFVEDINLLIKDRKKFWFFNYDHPDKFDLSNPEYFTNGGYGVFNSHMSFYGSKALNELLTEDLKKQLNIN